MNKTSVKARKIALGAEEKLFDIFPNAKGGEMLDLLLMAGEIFDNIQHLISMSFDEEEAQLKAKDAEIEKLTNILIQEQLINEEKDAEIERLNFIKMMYKHAIDSFNFIHQFTECDKARECAKIEVDRCMDNQKKLRGEDGE